jgi:hypothetical protein
MTLPSRFEWRRPRALVVRGAQSLQSPLVI